MGRGGVPLYMISDVGLQADRWRWESADCWQLTMRRRLGGEEEAIFDHLTMFLSVWEI
jgi:hypothetical protein